MADICDEQRVWPIIGGGVAVLSGGTVEALTRPQALARRQYCLERAREADAALKQGHGDPVTVQAAEARAMAYSAALNHPENVR